MPQLTAIEGVLERITFINEENGFSVVRLAIPGRRELVTAVGSLLGVQPGESLRLQGSWVHDHRFGEQFRVESFETVQPATLLGIEKYLGSGLVHGVGKVMASRLVQRFGMETLKVIEEEPWRLTHVEGIGPKRKERILAAWVEQKAIKEVMIFLQSHGVTTSYAVKIYKRYGDQSIEVVRANPYRLAQDIFGIGFKTADRIAANLGMPTTSPERAAAGVLWVLSQLADDGHLFCLRPALLEEAGQILEIDFSIIEQALGTLLEEQQIAIEQNDEGEQAVYLRALYVSEQGAAECLRQILDAPATPITIDVERALAWFEEQSHFELARQQREAVRQAATGKVLVITGGPGTGKTTIVNAIIRILEKKKRRILLAAPTGRAAKRLTETTGREAKTIHRLLEFDPRAQRFQRNQQHPLDADIVIIDEMSMVDMVLGYNLLKAVPLTAQVILVGDVDQLPSVGPGSVLKELIASRCVGVVRLTEIFRQAQESLIVVNAHLINQGLMPRNVSDDQGTVAEKTVPIEETDANAAAPDFFFIDREEPEQVLGTLKELVSKRVPQRFGFDPIEQIQVLTPMHRGLLGSQNLNAELQGLLNPSGEALAVGSRLLRAGDKVMQLRNNYDLEVFNGDIGRVLHIDAENREAEIQFDERVVNYTSGALDELVLGYACSIHKAQGSEYPAVIIPLHTQHYLMLQRNLLYTGITRGRRLVILVGSRKALAIAVRNHRPDARNTALAVRLRKLSGC